MLKKENDILIYLSTFQKIINPKSLFLNVENERNKNNDKIKRES